MKRLSLVGKKYGKLTVTEMIYGEYVGKRKRTKCSCICDCGNSIITVAEYLTCGKKTSCGCDTRQRRIDKNRIDLTGQRFNKLVVTEMVWGGKRTKAICRCDCGNTVTVINTGLTSGKTGSCGCLQRMRASEANIKDWTNIISPYNISFISQAKKNKAGQWLWNCKCGLCGNVFEALPARIMNGHITSCGCRRRSSKEDFIKDLLDSINVDYIEQYRFIDCKYRYTLPFDFAIINKGKPNLLIEYDGKQHYNAIEWFGGVDSLEITQERDSIKNKYCEDHNIPLLRLPYTLTEEEIKNKIINTIYP